MTNITNNSQLFAVCQQGGKTAVFQATAPLTKAEVQTAALRALAGQPQVPLRQLDATHLTTLGEGRPLEIGESEQAWTVEVYTENDLRLAKLEERTAQIELGTLDLSFKP